MYKYESIADDIEKLIGKKTLRTGERLPSVRTLSKQRNVSISTVMQAYMLLEARNILEARPKSGFFVRAFLRDRVPIPSKSAPSKEQTTIQNVRLISNFLTHLHREGLVPLGCAVPSMELLPVKQLNKILKRICGQPDQNSHDYEFPPGNPALRRSISARSLEWGCSVHEDQVIITAGCTEALNLSLRVLTKPGDSVAIASPAYYGHLHAIENLGLMAVEVATDPSSGIDLDALQNLLSAGRTRVCLLSPNCSNPLGESMPEENKKRLACMLAENDAMLIEDDIYGDLYFCSKRPLPVKSYDTNGNVILCSSISKTVSPGMRIGWVIHERLVPSIAELQFMSTISPSRIAQQTVAQYFSEGQHERHMRSLRRRFIAEIDHYREAVSERFPVGTKISRPTGGYVMWIELPKGVTSRTVFAEALKNNILIAPGPIFSPRGLYDNCIRISAGYPWSEQMDKAISTLAGIIHKAL